MRCSHILTATRAAPKHRCAGSLDRSTLSMSLPQAGEANLRELRSEMKQLQKGLNYAPLGRYILEQGMFDDSV